ARPALRCSARCLSWRLEAFRPCGRPPPLAVNAELRGLGVYLRAGNIPPHSDVDTMHDRLFAHFSGELEAGPVRAWRRLTPHRLHTTVRVQMEAVPARAVAGPALRPESVLALVMNLIQVRVSSRPRIEERVTGISMLFD